MCYFTIRQEHDGYRARFYGTTGRLMWSSEPFVTRAAAEHAVRTLRAFASNAEMRA